MDVAECIFLMQFIQEYIKTEK